MAEGVPTNNQRGLREYKEYNFLSFLEDEKKNLKKRKIGKDL